MGKTGKTARIFQKVSPLAGSLRRAAVFCRIMPEIRLFQKRPRPLAGDKISPDGWKPGKGFAIMDPRLTGAPAHAQKRPQHRRKKSYGTKGERACPAEKQDL